MEVEPNQLTDMTGRIVALPLGRIASDGTAAEAQASRGVSERAVLGLPK